MMNLQEYERIQPHTEAHGLKWFLPNSHVAWRVESLMTKEPDTVAWIRGMKAGQVFFDVGANIGQYSLLAWKQGLHVFAFEPESQNFNVLIRNLALNRVPKAGAVAFPFCISDEQRIDTLRLSDLRPGGSCHSFASNLNYKGESKEWAFEQGTVGFSLDSLVLECGLPQPTHIKVDVDGFEDKVIAGADKILGDVLSVLVELDSAQERHQKVISYMESRGFTFDLAQVDAARRKEGPFTGIGNAIFFRVETQNAAHATFADAGGV